MRYFALSRDEIHEVVAEQEGHGWRVQVDGRGLQVDVLPVGEGLYSLLLDGRSYEVDVLEDGRACIVLVNGQPFRVELRLERPASGPDGPRAATAGGGCVTAPMPGKLVKLLVAPGDAVAAGDGVAVLEAMKMENELKAPAAGRVADMRVAEGQTVSAGEVLVVIEGMENVRRET
ncbi:MAG: biotin/lipoyl-containing protein [Candidatus Methylomirabilales bacterium]